MKGTISPALNVVPVKSGLVIYEDIKTGGFNGAATLIITPLPDRQRRFLIERLISACYVSACKIRRCIRCSCLKYVFILCSYSGESKYSCSVRTLLSVVTGTSFFNAYNKDEVTKNIIVNNK